MKLKKAMVWLLACLLVSAMPFGVACGGSGADNGESSSSIGGGLDETSSNGGTSSSGGGSSDDVTQKTVKFGSYPQTWVKEENVVWALNEQAGALPSAENSQNWISYEYYKGNTNDVDYMWYQDVTHEGKQYRGVYFDYPRPYANGGMYGNGDNIYSYLDENGYMRELTYWFAFEELEWTVLEEKDGKALLLCKDIIDSQNYYPLEDNRTVDGATVYANNYAESYIRQWLNDSFYKTAFTATEQSKILTTLVNNGEESAWACENDEKEENRYLCVDTNDKIFLLSKQEATSVAYGFTADAWTADNAKWKKASDYALSQGCYVWKKSDSEYNRNSTWLLRSPSYQYNTHVACVNYDGRASDEAAVYQTSVGIVPAIWITL